MHELFLSFENKSKQLNSIHVELFSSLTLC